MPITRAKVFEKECPECHKMINTKGWLNHVRKHGVNPNSDGTRKLPGTDEFIAGTNQTAREKIESLMQEKTALMARLKEIDEEMTKLERYVGSDDISSAESSVAHEK